MIVAVAVLPFDVFAVIVAVPEPTAVTVPSDTAATLSLLVLHVTLLSVALEGVTVAVSLPVSPVESLSEEGETDTPVGSTMLSFFTTVTFTVAVLPFFVFAVIFAVPTETPFIVPPLTVATDSSLDDHVTVLYVAFEGSTVAVTDAVSCCFIVHFEGVTETLVSSTTSPTCISPLLYMIISAAPPSVRNEPLGITRPGAGVLAVLRT